MTLTTESSDITIEGNIKSIDDFQTIKSAIDAVTEEYDRIDFIIKDSISMTSSVIGYINKIIQKDHILVTMTVSDIRLYTTLEHLGLLKIFNVHKR